MTWIFGLFLVTPSALTGCHTVMSKKRYDSTIRVVGYNRCVNGSRPHGDNLAVRFRQSEENRSRAWDTQPIRSSLTSLQGGASVGTPWPPEKDMGRSPLSEYMSLHLPLN